MIRTPTLIISYVQEMICTPVAGWVMAVDVAILVTAGKHWIERRQHVGLQCT